MYQGVATTFNQTIIVKSNALLSATPDDCFNQINLVFYLDRVTVLVTPGAQTKCSPEYFQQVPYDYDRWFFMFGASELADGSGFKLIQEVNWTFVSNETLNVTLTCD